LIEHRLYLPTLDQLNDPADRRPKLAVLDAEQMVSFLVSAMVQVGVIPKMQELATNSLSAREQKDPSCANTMG